MSICQRSWEWGIWINGRSNALARRLRNDDGSVVRFATITDAAEKLLALGYVDSTRADIPNSACVCWVPPELA